MQLETHYLTYMEFPDLGIGVCDSKDFDGAVDAYAEHMDEGFDALVFRMEPGENGEAGMMIDVTDDAIACVAKRCRMRNEDMPECWWRRCNDPPCPHPHRCPLGQPHHISGNDRSRCRAD